MLDPSKWPDWSPPPRFATPADTSVPNRLDVFRALAEQLGITLFPWQEQVLATATERDAEGLPKYRDVLVSTPRQSGKSVLMVLVVLAHLQLVGKQLGFVSANLQTGQNLFRDAMWPILTRSGMVESMGLKLVSGALSPRLVSTATDSVCHIFAGSKQAGHGFVLDGAIIDEAWSATDNRSVAALRPAMSTREDAQLWIVSTVGVNEEQSPFLYGRMVEARKRIKEGVASRGCYFEWSGDPKADYRDPETWWAAMPALGRSITERTVEAALGDETEAEFRRAALNIWQDGEGEELGVFPAASWKSVCDAEAAIPDDAPVWVAVDCPPSQNRGSVAVSDGDVVGLVRYAKDVDWMRGFLEELIAGRDVQGVTAVGPMAQTIAQAAVNTAGGRKVEELVVPPLRVMTQATARMKRDVLVGDVRVLQGRSLDRAVWAALERPLGDERGWVYRHREVSSALCIDISPLWAVTLAWHDARTALEEPRVNRALPRILG